MNAENIANNIIAQAAPLFQQEETEVYTGMCCQKLYVGPRPERVECSSCKSQVTFYAVPAGATREDVTVIAELMIDPAPFQASLDNA